MSKPVKNLIIESYKRRFDGVDQGILIDMRGVSSNDNNRLRTSLAQKQARVTVVKNSLAQKAFAETDLALINDLLDGPSALVYPVGDDATAVSLARELLDWAKQIEQLEFKGAILEGVTFGPDQIEALSKYPTKDEAQATAVQILLSPGQNLVGSILGPGRQIAGLVDAIKEKLEKGETIEKVA